MSLVYSRDSKGAKTFSGKLLNVSDPDNPEDISLSGALSYFVQFLSPTGKRYEKTALVDEDSISGTTDDMDIFYTTTDDDSVYNSELGRWAYRVGVRFSNGTVTTSPDWVPFWVSI